MKPLNRPMFRYGGPIKEGIMTGMKDNRQAINTVGSPLAPKDETGRQGYALPVLGFLGANALRTAAMRAVPKIANLFRTQVGTKTVQKAGPSLVLPGRTKTMGAYSGKIPGKTIGPGTAEVPVMGPTKLGAYFQSDPVIATGGKVIQGLTSPTSKGIIQKGARLVFSPTGIVTGAYYAGGKFFDGDGNEIPEEVVQEQGLTTGRQFTGDEAAIGDPRKPLPDSKPKPNVDDLTKDRIEKTKERYYKLMGIDKMNKEAVYDSLIDASKVIQQEGADLKGSLKSGSLQTQIIDAISKNLDKSAALKKQIDAAVLKGEIEKDIAGAKPGSYLKQAQDYAAMKNISVDQAYKELGFNKQGDLMEDVRAYSIKNDTFPSGNQLAGLARGRGIDITSVADTTEVKNFKKDNKGKDEVDFLEAVVAGGGAGNGVYVVNDRILLVKDGKVSPYL